MIAYSLMKPSLTKKQSFEAINSFLETHRQEPVGFYGNTKWKNTGSAGVLAPIPKHSNF